MSNNDAELFWACKVCGKHFPKGEKAYHTINFKCDPTTYEMDRFMGRASEPEGTTTDDFCGPCWGKIRQFIASEKNKANSPGKIYWTAQPGTEMGNHIKTRSGGYVLTPDPSGYPTPIIHPDIETCGTINSTGDPNAVPRPWDHYEYRDAKTGRIDHYTCYEVDIHSDRDTAGLRYWTAKYRYDAGRNK